MAEVLRGNQPLALRRAVALLQAGELVAFATETVYGLGADATNVEAVAKIFEVKGRPQSNPLIVHVLDAEMAKGCATGWDARCDALAAAFWPGPLTLVLARHASIPAIVTAGGPTVAVRAPSHVVARALLAHFEGPLAAPSANRSSAISPTRAAHVVAELGDRIALVLDGGPCTVGLESTVLDMTGETPLVLRPGAVTRSAIAEVLGAPVDRAGRPRGVARSPGLASRHYAPARPMRTFQRGDALGAGAILYLDRGPPEPEWAVSRALPADPEGYGRTLYEALRWADAQPVDQIWVELPPVDEAWDAVHDRIQRACAS